MRELDRLDAAYGLGALPTPRRTASARRGRSVSLSLLAVVGAVSGTCVILAFAPVEAGTVFRQLTGINRPDRLLPEVTPAAGAGSYALLNELPSGDPVTYDPCRPIHYVVNPEAGPKDYRSFIEPAIREIEAASGLRFLDDGLSDDAWGSRSSGLSRRPVLITFNRPAEVAELRGDIVGVGGSLSWAPSGRTPRYLTGSVALDAEWFGEASREGRTLEQKSVVMHELGHVLGLDHVDDPHELMYADNVGQLTFGPGDLTGLSILGAGRCD